MQRQFTSITYIFPCFDDLYTIECINANPHCTNNCVTICNSFPLSTISIFCWIDTTMIFILPSSNCVFWCTPHNHTSLQCFHATLASHMHSVRVHSAASVRLTHALHMPLYLCRKITCSFHL